MLQSFDAVDRDREERLAALSAAQQEAMEELQKKIQMKVTLHYVTLCPYQTLYRSTDFPIWSLDSDFFRSMTRAAVGTWSKSSRGRRRLLSSAVVDTLTQTTPPNWRLMSARNSAPSVAWWYVEVHHVTQTTYMDYVKCEVTSSLLAGVPTAQIIWNLFLFWPILVSNQKRADFYNYEWRCVCMCIAIKT